MAARKKTGVELPDFQSRRRRRPRGKIGLGDLNLQLTPPMEEPPDMKFRFVREENVTYYTEEGDWEPVKENGIPYTVTGKAGTVMHLLAMPRAWYEEDYAAEQERIVRVGEQNPEVKRAIEDLGEGGTPAAPNERGFYDRQGHNAEDMLR